jgi:UDP-N-acetylmuramoyl-L-alanyl-D-glutamate--2,6-diaminopimelate ligase
VATLLAAVRQLTPGRVIAVLGCGGDRDRSKRPLMGRAVVQGADIAILTSDNPRNEDPDAILAEMAADAPGALVEPDRRVAIELAVARARPGDTVVVAGKGHETGQEAAGVVTPFDDREVLREALS